MLGLNGNYWIVLWINIIELIIIIILKINLMVNKEIFCISFFEEKIIDLGLWK